MSTISDRKPANAAPDRFGGVFDELRVGFGALGRVPSGGRRERVGDAGKVLHGTVVEIARDLAAFDVARLERAVEQQLSLAEP